MIRKVIIVTMLLLAAATVVITVVSYPRPCYLRIQTLPTIHVDIVVIDGNFVLFCLQSDNQEVMDQLAADTELPVSTGLEVRHFLATTSTFGRSFQLMFRQGGPFGLTTVIRFPFYLTAVVLLAYPTFAFIRGPLRRHRRRKKGSCIPCGYDLTGNKSGVCPECGEGVT